MYIFDCACIYTIYKWKNKSWKRKDNIPICYALLPKIGNVKCAYIYVYIDKSYRAIFFAITTIINTREWWLTSRVSNSYVWIYVCAVNEICAACTHILSRGGGVDDDDDDECVSLLGRRVYNIYMVMAMLFVELLGGCISGVFIDRIRFWSKTQKRACFSLLFF